jgi:hypothetical protein
MEANVINVSRGIGSFFGCLLQKQCFQLIIVSFVINVCNFLLVGNAGFFGLHWLKLGYH